MANQAEFVETRRAHPDWDAKAIAKALNCSTGYIRATARRLRHQLPKASLNEPVASDAKHERCAHCGASIRKAKKS